MNTNDNVRGKFRSGQNKKKPRRHQRKEEKATQHKQKEEFRRQRELEKTKLSKQR